jgi:hypothetical protein
MLNDIETTDGVLDRDDRRLPCFAGNAVDC